MVATLWVDVEDLFDYAAGNSRPSGIQRLAFEIYREFDAIRRDDCVIRFVRHDRFRDGFYVVSWSAIEALFAGLTDRALAPGASLDGRPAMSGGGSAGRGRLQRLLRALPARVRPAAGEVAGAGVALARAVGRFASVATARRPAASVPTQPNPGGDIQAMQRGDVILVLGAPWSFTHYESLIRRHRDEFGARFAVLIYDLIPILRPEFFDATLVRLFTGWLLPMLPLCDHVFAISACTAADCERFVARCGIVLPDRVRTLPIGTRIMMPPAGEAAGTTRILPAPGTYVLCVSTIEVRKNHLLLFRAWRRLLEEMPAAEVPTLVFAGRVGWLVHDLICQIANTDNLDGKLVVLDGPTDGELAALYSGCLFTLFPSFYEGWGLPVTESLAAGKPCLTSNTSSMPEAGAGLTRMFDPDNLHDAYAVIRATLEDRAGLAEWEAQVRRDFKPVSWSMSAAALLAALFPPSSKTEAELVGSCEA